MRWAFKGRGKSGGARVMYYFHSETMPLILLSVFAKYQKVNPGQVLANQLNNLVPALVREFLGTAGR